jgi:hypothetical protein
MKCTVLLDIILEGSFANEPLVGFVAEEDDSGWIVNGEIEGGGRWSDTLEWF